MAKHATSWLIQHEVPQGCIPGYPVALFPHGFSWRWGNTTNNYITYLTFGMAGDNMNGFGTAHGFYP